MVKSATTNRKTQGSKIGYAKMIAALIAGPIGIPELSNASGLWETSVRQYLQALRSVEPKLVFIETWATHPDAPGIKFPKYRLGNGPDARKPRAMTPKEKVARRTAQRVEARRQEVRSFSMVNSIFNYSQQSGAQGK